MVDRRNQKKKQSGITLIALVITVIVLLILAGVTISALSGQNGILQNALKAKEETEKAERKEQEEIQKLEMEMASENGEIYDYEYVNNEGKTVTVPIPSGFTVSEVEGEKTIEEGFVIKDSRGNEYVWIPCTTDEASTELKYQRTLWSVEDDGGTRSEKDELELTNGDITYIQTDLDNGINEETSQEIVNQINAEKASIEKYGGFYIGRYEVGNESDIPVIKKNQEPYSNIKWSEAYSLAKSIGGGKNAETYLCSSYAWDTAINFIQNNGATNYATSVAGFNGNWLNQEVRDEEGNIIKQSGTAQRLNTGLTTAQSNIYDMGGNMAEFTTELNPGTSAPVVLRGGGYYRDGPAGLRWDIGAAFANSDYGFRATLFLK